MKTKSQLQNKSWGASTERRIDVGDFTHTVSKTRLPTKETHIQASVAGIVGPDKIKKTPWKKKKKFEKLDFFYEYFFCCAQWVQQIREQSNGNAWDCNESEAGLDAANPVAKQGAALKESRRTLTLCLASTRLRSSCTSVVLSLLEIPPARVWWAGEVAGFSGLDRGMWCVRFGDVC